MKHTNFIKGSKTLLFYCLYVIVNGCNGQSKDLENCKLHYRKATANIDIYYQNKDTSLLKNALGDVEQSLECPETKKASIEIKIGILSLLKEYGNAYRYIDSLKDSDFKLKYKKMMDYNYFLALDRESKSDTIGRNRFIDSAKSLIQNYINKESKFDEEAYYDLFYISSKS
jgi:hypothetical protein